MVALSLRAAAREAPERIALVIGDEQYSFSDLAARAAAVSPLLGNLERVAIVAEPTADAVAAAFAAIEAAKPFVPIHPSAPAATRDALVNRSGAVLLDRAPNAEPSNTAVPAATDDELAIVFTSGSTGSPKGVILSRRAVLASATASAKYLGWRDHDRWL